MIQINEFVFFALFGLIAEVLFTSVRSKDKNLIGHTSLWMIPIYSVGLTYGFDFIKYLISHDIIRWLSYPLWIWATEIIFGTILLKFNIKAWDYNFLPDNLHWKGLISFAHYPVWIFFGIAVELLKANLVT